MVTPIVPVAPRGDFPLLARVVEGRTIAYLDAAATNLKPRAVIDAVVGYYEGLGANVHRGAHRLSDETSTAFEAARDAVARFIQADARELVFTANTTHSIGVVAQGLDLKRGDNVVTSVLEHHSNILPWLSRCETRFLREGPDGLVDFTALDGLIDEHTRLVALSQASNVTGAISALGEVIEHCHRRGVPVLVDAAQSAAHFGIDVRALGCDFLAFSSHKLCGPSGVGVLYLSEPMWERVALTNIGGGTVLDVSEDAFRLKRVPHRFEAGTPNIEGVLGLGAAVRYLEAIGMEAIAAHDRLLSARLLSLLEAVPGIGVLGPTDPKNRIGLASVVPTKPGLDVEMLSMMLCDSHGVMARAGTLCAHPYFKSRGLKGALRFSGSIFTSDEDLERGAAALDALLNR